MSYDAAQAEYDSLRTLLFQFFDDWTRRLGRSIDLLLPLIGELEAAGVRNPLCDDLRDLVNGFRQPQPFMTLSDITSFDLTDEPDADRLAAIPADHLAKDAEFAELAHVPLVAFWVANLNLKSQLRAIRSAASMYTLEIDEGRRMVLEHNLVRAGADLKDWVSRLFSSEFWPQWSETGELGYRTLKGLEAFCSSYEDVLRFYELFTLVIRPLPKEYEWARATNVKVARGLREGKVATKPTPRYQLLLGPCDIDVW